MRRVIGIDIHRTFGEVVIWENGVLRHAGRVAAYVRYEREEASQCSCGVEA